MSMEASLEEKEGSWIEWCFEESLCCEKEPMLLFNAWWIRWQYALTAAYGEGDSGVTVVTFK